GRSSTRLKQSNPAVSVARMARAQCISPYTPARPFVLVGAVESVARVAEARHNVGLLVEAFVERAEHERHVAVARGGANRLDALGCAEYTDRGDVFGAAVKQKLDGARERTAGGQHRIEHEALPPHNRVGQPLSVGRRLERLF